MPSREGRGSPASRAGTCGTPPTQWSRSSTSRPSAQRQALVQADPASRLPGGGTRFPRCRRGFHVDQAGVGRFVRMTRSRLVAQMAHCRPTPSWQAGSHPYDDVSHHKGVACTRPGRESVSLSSPFTLRRDPYAWGTPKRPMTCRSRSGCRRASMSLPTRSQRNRRLHISPHGSSRGSAPFRRCAASGIESPCGASPPC